MTGLNTTTPIHMLRSVLTKTPGPWDSTNWLELSKPETPSMPAQVPKYRALKVLPSTVSSATLASG
eukprot:12302775-Prorocentrum_lima.AAC.1